MREIARRFVFLGLMLLLHQFFVNAQGNNDTIHNFADSLNYNSNSINTIADTIISSTPDSTIIHTDSTNAIINDSSVFNNDNAIISFFQRKDSLDVYVYSFFNDSINYQVLHYIDTINHHSGEYSPVKYFNVAYNDLGIIGSAQDNQVFMPTITSGFNMGFNNQKAYMRFPQDIQLTNTRTPFTNLLYVMGAKKEHILKVSHAQSFKDQQITANFDFNLFNHLGAYSHQQTDVKSFYGGLGYRTKNSQYRINAQYYINKQVNEENGGIDSLELFENTVTNNREVIGTNLSNAENFFRKYGVAFQQSFNISNPEPDFSNIPDTNLIEFEGGYSVTHFKKPFFDPVSHLGQIKHYFHYQATNLRYTDKDQDSRLYDGIPYYSTPDSTIFFDSIGMRKYVNEIIYSNNDYKDDPYAPKFLNYFFGGRHEYNEYYQDSSKQYFTHYALIGGVFINLTKQLSLLSDVEYYVGDYANNDLNFNAKAFLKLKENLFTAGIRINHRSPDWIYHSYSSSRFTWNNNFDKSDIQQLYLKFSRKNLDVFIQVQNINQLVYLNEFILPEQSNDNIQHIIIQAQKNFRVGHWGTDLMGIYQTVSHPNTIRVPDFTAKMKLFYNNILFNNALDLEVGVQLSYFTAYYADQYMPAIRSFHIQNNQLIGDYPYIDAYINAKIGKARIFVRYDHFNAGMLGYTYYSSPNYPAQDAAFRLGVSWLLFN